MIEVLGAHRFTNEVTLRLVATGGTKGLCLRTIFDPSRGRGNIQRSCQGDGCFENAGPAPVVVQPPYQPAFEFHPVEPELAERADAGKAATEVVQRKSDATFLQCVFRRGL